MSVKIEHSGYEISGISSANVITKTLTKIDLTIEEIEKGEFPHFMLKKFMTKNIQSVIQCEED